MSAATPDPLDMLDVIEESRQNAMAQREAALDHLATVALQALVEGRDVREIARRCGFVAQEVEAEKEPANEVMGGRMFSSFLWMPGETEDSPNERFADWLSKAVRRLVLEGLENAQ